MELNIIERLLILNLDTLPRVGNILTMKCKQQLLNDVGFSEEDIKEANLKNDDDGKVSWDKMIIKDVNIGESALKLLVDAIEKSENVNDLYVPLYDKLKACNSDKDKPETI
jgi:hypothetical protein